MSRVEHAGNGFSALSRAARAHIDPAPAHLQTLRGAGLTNRQAEVAFWIAHAKSNEEVAAILGASPRTIAHHVEAILERLRLTNRIQVMLHTLEMLGWLRWPCDAGSRNGQHSP